MANIPEIKLPAETIFQIAGVPITNSIIATAVVTTLLILFALLINRKISLVPGRLQLMMEGLIDYFMMQLETVFGSEKRARRQLPYILTLFLFIVVANQFSILPLLGQIITPDGINLFRTPTSDYSLPITLAIITVIGSNLIAFGMSPLRYIGKFIKITSIFKARSLSQLGMAILEFFIGLLDIIGEIAKLISLSSRLFGNIFAGEAMFLIITGLSVYTSYFVPIPFLVLSLASGVIQALVFSLLAMNFMAGTLPEPEEERA